MSTSTVPGIRYHWIITIQRDGLPSLRTREGVVTPEPGETRQQLYYRICDDLREPSSFGTLFFSLEPDELPVPAALNGAER